MMTVKTVPGTNIPYAEGAEATANIRMMIEAADGLSLGQICRITGLETSTIQNWVKRGYAFRPVKKKYYEKHVSRILLISALRECMLIEEIGELMALINGNLEDESDDIVSESDLYEYFCLAVRKLDETPLNEENVNALSEKALKAYKGPNRNRLLRAIRIMVYA